MHVKWHSAVFAKVASLQVERFESTEAMFSNCMLPNEPLKKLRPPFAVFDSAIETLGAWSTSCLASDIAYVGIDIIFLLLNPDGDCKSPKPEHTLDQSMTCLRFKLLV